VRQIALAVSVHFVDRRHHHHREGFGLPVPEAFASGTPVLTSDLPVLREVAGNGALLVDPREVAAIAEGLLRIGGDECLRRELAARGRARAAGFRWEKTAERILAIYRRVADAHATCGVAARGHRS